MPPTAHRSKQQPLITKLIDSLMQGQSESQDSIVGLVAKAAATTGGGSRSEDFSPTALKTADQQDFSFVAASGLLSSDNEAFCAVKGRVLLPYCASLNCR